MEPKDDQKRHQKRYTTQLKTDIEKKTKTIPVKELEKIDVFDPNRYNKN